MDIEELKFVAKCLGGQRRVFHYFRYRYAFLILERMAVDGLTVAELKKSDLACLFNKPAVKEHLGRLGSSTLGPEHFGSAWLEPVCTFCINLGAWTGRADCWSQVCRTGSNLVLRLNFNRRHMQDYLRLYRPTRKYALNHAGHPINRKGDLEHLRETLAWARIDFSLDTGEALIEEIQTDWCRKARSILRYARWAKDRGNSMPERTYSAGTAEAVIEYVDGVLNPYAACCHEAVLAAAIVFIRDELGIRRIYYHTAEFGHKLKRIRYDRPPRSLYSTLPRSFGFRQTEDSPHFLREDKTFRRLYRKLKPISWYVLEFPGR